MKTTMTAVWAEIFGVAVLGTIRSAVTMYMVVASALAPFAFGAALDAGWTVIAASSPRSSSYGVIGDRAAALRRTRRGLSLIAPRRPHTLNLKSITSPSWTT